MWQAEKDRMRPGEFEDGAKFLGRMALIYLLGWVVFAVGYFWT